MGHVSPRPIREERPRDDLSRRQHRGDRAPDQALKLSLARWGESVAAGFLERRGASLVDCNLQVGGGELDLVVRFGRQLVVVEVKTIGLSAIATDPIHRIDQKKLEQVRKLAGHVAKRYHQAIRVDFVGVRMADHGVEINWRTAVA